MKLHYSQTCAYLSLRATRVSVPYEITLLSNDVQTVPFYTMVSAPYEITLLSNRGWYSACGMPVSVPYEITLLSNTNPIIYDGYGFQYLMKLHYSQTVKS